MSGPEQPDFGGDHAQQERILTMYDLQELYRTRLDDMAVGYDADGSAIGMWVGVLSADIDTGSQEGWPVWIRKADPLSVEGLYGVTIVHADPVTGQPAAPTNVYNTLHADVQYANPWDDRRLRSLLSTAVFYRDAAEEGMKKISEQSSLSPALVIGEGTAVDVPYSRVADEVSGMMRVRQAEHAAGQPQGSRVVRALKRAVHAIRQKKTR